MLSWSPTKHFFASSVKCVDIHHDACIKAVIIYLCSAPNNICTNISKCEIKLMLFWLWKDAQLALRRRPFEVLLTPFWTLTNALLKHGCANIWFTVGYNVAEIRHFCTSFWAWRLYNCQDISDVFLLYLTGYKRTVADLDKSTVASMIWI